jgi:hypothetical protein
MLLIFSQPKRFMISSSTLHKNGTAGIALASERPVAGYVTAGIMSARYDHPQAAHLNHLVLYDFHSYGFF